MVSPRLLRALFVVSCIASPLACATGLTPGGTAGDAAARWGDVALPDVTVPDGYLITSATPDGQAATSTPTSVCQTIGAVDGGEDATADAATSEADGGDALTPATDAAADAMVPNACTTPLEAGSLVFDEVMIASEPGSDDRGQWLEVRSTLTCSANLLGLHASALHGESFRTLDVTTDTWLPPLGYFLIADTTDATENNMLPGLVLAWAGSPADALHKTSDVITLSLGMVTIDTLSYPAKTRPEATSMAFPSNCAPALRADFANWMPSMASWVPGFYGTPNAANTDVMCAAATLAACTGLRRGPR